MLKRYMFRERLGTSTPNKQEFLDAILHEIWMGGETEGIPTHCACGEKLCGSQPHM